MEKMKQIPLKQRLQKVAANTPNFLVAFEIYLEEYFQGLTDIGGNPYFVNYYQNQIRNDARIQTTDILLATLLQSLDSVPYCEQMELLMTIFVEPFAILSEYEKEDKVCISG